MSCCDTTPDKNGYTPLNHDPRHRQWIGMGFCIKCGGYSCTTPVEADAETLRRRIRDTEGRLAMLREELEAAEKKRGR